MSNNIEIQEYLRNIKLTFVKSQQLIGMLHQYFLP